MTPAAILLLIQGIEAAIAAAPQVVSVAESAKTWISSLVSAGVISVEQQNTLFSHVDAVCQALIAGQVPPEFKVDPSPS